MVGALTILTQTNTFFEMKKILFLSMGLLTAMVFSPPTLAVDTGPKMGSEDYSISAAPVPASTNDIAFMAVGDEVSNIISYFEQAYGRETVPEPSDHSVTSYDMNFNSVDLNNSKKVIFGALAVAEERQRSRGNITTHDVSNIFFTDLDDHRSTGLASATAAPANTSCHSMAWVTSYLSGSDLRG
jgi:hypothetical protein